MVCNFGSYQKTFKKKIRAGYWILFLRSSCFPPGKYECSWSLKWRKAPVFKFWIYMHILEALKLAHVYVYTCIWACMCVCVFMQSQNISRMTDFMFEPLCTSHWHCRWEVSIHEAFVLNKLPVQLQVFFIILMVRGMAVNSCIDDTYGDALTCWLHGYLHWRSGVKQSDFSFLSCVKSGITSGCLAEGSSKLVLKKRKKKKPGFYKYFKMISRVLSFKQT